MFKKIEIWILYLVIILGIILSLAFGVLVRQEIEGITKAGRFDISFLSKPAAYIARLPENFLRTILKSNPNIVNDPWDEYRYFYNQKSFSGSASDEEMYLLLSRYDGDLLEGIVELVDLTNFNVLHTWNPDIDAFNALIDLNNKFKYIKRDKNNARHVIYHPVLTSDGSLNFGWGTPFRKINHCSDLIFQQTQVITHHAIEIDYDGNIWVPSRKFPSSLPPKLIGENLHPQDGGYYDDAILKLSNDGEVLFEKSISQIFIDNNLEHFLFGLGNSYEPDPIHLNDIQPVNFDGDYWKKGDIFLSLRNQSMIILYRPSVNKIIWKAVGPFMQQHDVDILDRHRISIFNNRSIYTQGNVNIVDGHNEVIIYDFKTDNYSSYLQDSFLKHDIRTISEGLSEILPNGDLFLEESNYGRTLYFNSDGSLKWSHVNQANDGHVYRVGWSRILYRPDDIKLVNNFLANRSECNE